MKGDDDTAAWCILLVLVTIGGAALGQVAGWIATVLR